MATERVKKYITFKEVANPGKKTRRWGVYSTNGGIVGWIQWHGAWRKYCYFHAPDTLSDQDCMRFIADFLEARNKEHYGNQS